MIDLVTEFNSVYIIESLKQGATHTGKNLFDGALVDRKSESSWLDIDYLATPDAASFDAALEIVLQRTRAGRLPILHIEAHGSRHGIRLADGTLVEWESIREILTAINKASRCRLVVVMAMCKGAHLASVLRPPNPAPAWAVVGPSVDIDDLPMEQGMWLYYDALLSGKGGNEALNQLNQAQCDPTQRYVLHSAEESFHFVLWRFFQNRTPEIVQEHENTLVAEAARSHGYSLVAASIARSAARRRISDEQYWYDFWRPRFLMLDIYPENEGRFRLTYDDYKAARARFLPEE